MEVFAAFKDAFASPSRVSKTQNYERWLDKALVDRWSWLNSRHNPPSNSSSTVTLFTPLVVISSASANKQVSPLLGVNAGEGSDFDVVAAEIQLIGPSFTKSVIRDTLNSMTVDVATTTGVTWTDMAFNLDVQNSTSLGTSKNIAVEKGALLAINCGQSKLELKDSQRGNSTTADLGSADFTIATNATPALLSTAQRWNAAVTKLSQPDEPIENDRADHLDYTWRIIQAAEQQGINSEPKFLGMTGPLLRPPDTLAVDHIASASILSLRDDVGWRILSQLRHYTRQLAGWDSQLSTSSVPPDATPEDLQASIYGHFVNWREWDVPEYDWIDLHCLQTSRQVEQSKLSRQDIAFDSYSINDRKANLSMQELHGSLFDVTALEGQQLAIISATGLACAVWNAQTTDRAVRVQTVTLAAKTFDVGVHVDLAQYVLPIYDIYERSVETEPVSAPQFSRVPTTVNPDMRRCFIFGIDKMGLRINAEPLQFAFDTHGTHVVYSMCSNSGAQESSDRTSATRDAINMVTRSSTMAVLHMNGSDPANGSGLPRLFSVTLEGGQAALFPNLRMPSNTSKPKPSASILIQSVSLETGYDPRSTQAVIQRWKLSRFS